MRFTFRKFVLFVLFCFLVTRLNSSQDWTWQRTGLCCKVKGLDVPVYGVKGECPPWAHIFESPTGSNTILEGWVTVMRWGKAGGNGSFNVCSRYSVTSCIVFLWGLLCHVSLLKTVSQNKTVFKLLLAGYWVSAPRSINKVHLRMADPRD